MAQQTGPERGLKNPFSVRTGIDIPKFRGTNTQGDPGSIGVDQFQALENVSFDGTRWGSRDGQSKVNSAAAMTGCVYGMWDDDDGLGFGGGPVRVYGGAPTSGGAIYAYDSELSTPTQQFKQNPLETATQPRAILDIHEEFAALRLGAVAEDETAEENLSTRLIIGGTAGRVYEWVPASPPEGRTLLDTAAYPKHILTIPGLTGGEIYSLAWWEGVLYILADHGSSCVVYAYEGETLTLEDTVTATGGVLGVRQGEILAAYSGASPNLLRVRSVTGTWSSPTFPAVDGTWTSQNIMEYGTKSYIGGLDDSDIVVLSWDGTTCAVARTPASKYRDYGVAGQVVFNGELCVLYTALAEVAGQAKIATYDGSTWTNSEKSFERDQYGRGLAVSKGTLVGMLYEYPNETLNVAPGTDVSGTWTELDSGSADGPTYRTVGPLYDGNETAYNGGIVAV